MTALKWITTEAKKIRKKYPKKEWKDCVKQASAIYASKHGGKSPVKKKKKKAIGAVKKVAKKKTAKKKTTKKSGEYHKDTKSHNVNIRVVSGIENEKYSQIVYIKYLQKFGKRVLLKNSFEKIVYGNTFSKPNNKEWLPIVENGILMYYIPKTKFSYSGTKAEEVRFLIPDNNYELAKTKSQLLAKSMLYNQ